MNIYLLRHTRVNVAPGTCYGQSDVPLADSFPEEVERIRQKLPQGLPAVTYSSPLQRCRQLAERISPDCIKEDARLMELHFGDWEMKKWNDIGLGALNQLTSDALCERCPGGESYMDLFHRAVNFWQDLVQSREEDVLVVTHGGIVRALTAHLLDIPLEKSLLLGIDYGGMTHIEIMQGTPVVQYINR